MTTLPLYQTRHPREFYEYEAEYNTLDGGPHVLPAGTKVGIVRRGPHDPDRYLMATEDGLLAWMWLESLDWLCSLD